MLEPGSAASSMRAVSGGSSGASTMSPSADSCAPANIATRVRPALPHGERRDADELARALGDEHVRLAREGRLREPGEHPGREQIRARARHGLDQRVPGAVELCERRHVGQRAHPRQQWR